MIILILIYHFYVIFITSQNKGYEMKRFLILLVGLAVSLLALDINKASVDEFASIKGIGEKKAEAIVKYRSEVGKFKGYEDLLNVKGIGEKTLENIKNDVYNKNANKSVKNAKESIKKDKKEANTKNNPSKQNKSDKKSNKSKKDDGKK